MKTLLLERCASHKIDVPNTRDQILSDQREDLDARDQIAFCEFHSSL